MEETCAARIGLGIGAVLRSTAYAGLWMRPLFQPISAQ